MQEMVRTRAGVIYRTGSRIYLRYTLGMDKTHMTRLGDAIKATYKEAGLTQDELAEAVGASQSNVSDWVRGVRPPSIEQVLAIDAACGAEAGYTLREAGLIKDDPAGPPEPEIEIPEHLREAIDRAFAPIRAQVEEQAAEMDRILEPFRAFGKRWTDQLNENFQQFQRQGDA